MFCRVISFKRSILCPIPGTRTVDLLLDKKRGASNKGFQAVCRGLFVANPVLAVQHRRGESCFASDV